MSGFRLHIDIPIPATEEDAVAISKRIMDALLPCASQHRTSIDGINWRLGHDEDRQRSNYLVKTPSGHVTHKKCRATTEELGQWADGFADRLIPGSTRIETWTAHSTDDATEANFNNTNYRRTDGES